LLTWLLSIVHGHVWSLFDCHVADSDVAPGFHARQIGGGACSDKHGTGGGTYHGPKIYDDEQQISFIVHRSCVVVHPLLFAMSLMVTWPLLLV